MSVWAGETEEMTSNFVGRGDSKTSGCTRRRLKERLAHRRGEVEADIRSTISSDSADKRGEKEEAGGRGGGATQEDELRKR